MGQKTGFSEATVCVPALGLAWGRMLHGSESHFLYLYNMDTTYLQDEDFILLHAQHIGGSTKYT